MMMFCLHWPRFPSEAWRKPRGPVYMLRGGEIPGPVCSDLHIDPENSTRLDLETL